MSIEEIELKLKHIKKERENVRLALLTEKEQYQIESLNKILYNLYVEETELYSKLRQDHWEIA